jgi:hypothetical protein
MHKTLLAGAACLLLLGVVDAAELTDVPTLKEGLWKIHSVNTSAGQPPMDTTTSLCRNHAYDQEVEALSQKAMVDCSILSDVKLAGKRTMTVSCKVKGSIVTTKSVISHSGDNYYRSETQATYTPPLYGMSSDSRVQEQTYVGACPAGMSPGDRMLANGEIQHHRRN